MPGLAPNVPAVTRRKPVTGPSDGRPGQTGLDVAGYTDTTGRAHASAQAAADFWAGRLEDLAGQTGYGPDRLEALGEFVAAVKAIASLNGADL